MTSESKYQTEDHLHGRTVQEAKYQLACVETSEPWLLWLDKGKKA
jgi:hypothetical protein